MATDSRGYLLPDNVEPPDVVCVKVFIPNDPLYLREFWDAYGYFAQWSAWKRDPLKRGKLAARAWLKAFDLARDEYILKGNCTMAITNIRQNPLNPCVLEFSEDGSTWTQFADLKDCGGGCGGSNEVLRLTDGVVERYDPCADDWKSAGPKTPITGGHGDASGSMSVSSNTACLAATNIAHVVATGANAGWAIYEATSNALLLANTIAGAFALITPGFEWFDGIAVWIADLILNFEGMISEIVAIDLEAELAQMLTPYISSDGGMTQANWSAFQADEIAKAQSVGEWTAEGCAWGMVNLITYILGPAGLVKAESLGGITESDCGSPEWVKTFDFTSSQGGWARTLDAGQRYGVWQSGHGWKSELASNATVQATQLEIYLSFQETTITRVDVEFDASTGSFSSGSPIKAICDALACATNLASGALSDGENQIYSWSGSELVSTLNVALLTGVAGLSDPPPGGSSTIRRITIRGSGENPFI